MPIPSTPRPGRRLGILAGLAVLTLALTAPLAWRGGAAGPINTGDGQLSIWNVSWVARALVADPLHVFDANVFAPHRTALAFSEANLPAGALGVPAWWLTRNPYATYNSVVCLSLLLASLATYGLVHSLTGSRPAAFVAAILFAFAPFVTVRYAHIQLLVTGGLPLTLWAMHRFVDRQTAGRALALSAAIALSGLCCGYYGFFAATAAGVGLIYYALSRQLWRRVSYLALCLLAGVGAAAAILPFFLPYADLLGGSQPFRTLDEARLYSATIRSYLTSTGRLHRLAIGAFVPPLQADFPERVLFPGILASGLAAAAVVAAFWTRGQKRRDGGAAGVPLETVGYYLVLTAVAGWLSAGPDGGLYATAYRYIPAWSLLRAPSRFGILVTLALVVLAGQTIAWWLGTTRHRRLTAAAIVIAAIADVAAVPWDARDALPVPGAYRMIAALPPGTVAEFPFFYRPIDFHRHSLYMLYSTYHWHPLVNGYSDRIPEDFKAIAVPVSSFPAWEPFRLLRERGASYVVFHMNLYDYRSREKLLERLERYKAFLEPLYLRDDVWLYEIVAWPE